MLWKINLIYRPLKKAKVAYEKALKFAMYVESKEEKQHHEFELKAAKSTLIQHFEFTYELCWKTMKRYIEMGIGLTPNVEGGTIKDLFRISGSAGSIDDFEAWINKLP